MQPIFVGPDGVAIGFVSRGGLAGHDKLQTHHQSACRASSFSRTQAWVSAMILVNTLSRAPVGAPKEPEHSAMKIRRSLGRFSATAAISMVFPVTSATDLGEFLKGSGAFQPSSDIAKPTIPCVEVCYLIDDQIGQVVDMEHVTDLLARSAVADILQGALVVVGHYPKCNNPLVNLAELPRPTMTPQRLTAILSPKFSRYSSMSCSAASLVVSVEGASSRKVQILGHAVENSSLECLHLPKQNGCLPRAMGDLPNVPLDKPDWWRENHTSPMFPTRFKAMVGTRQIGFEEVIR